MNVSMDKTEIAQWLDGASPAQANIVATRAALRTLPLIAWGPASDGGRETLALRCLFIAWCMLRYGEQGLRSIGTELGKGDGAADTRQLFYSAASAASYDALAGAAGLGVPHPRFAFEYAHWAATNAANLLSDADKSFEDAAEQFVRATALDIKLMMDGGQVFTSPLWARIYESMVERLTPVWVSRSLARSQGLLNVSYLEKWYRELLEGQARSGPGEEKNDLWLAHQPASWWNKPPNLLAEDLEIQRDDDGTPVNRDFTLEELEKVCAEVAAGPPEMAKALLARVSLRTLPSRLEDKHLFSAAPKRLALWRANFIGWAANIYPHLNSRPWDMSPTEVDEAGETSAALRMVTEGHRRLLREGLVATYNFCDPVITIRNFADVWRALLWDQGFLHEKSDPQFLMTMPLWGESETPEWAAIALSKALYDSELPSLLRWYESVLSGGEALFGEALDTQIAQMPNPWWERSLEEIRRDIDTWTANAGSKSTLSISIEPDAKQWDFFVSYSQSDEGDARFIGEVLESAGSSIFAQYKSMPPGSNFVNEMKRGLKGYSRFIAVYSPAYESSGHCQAEWNAAYQRDTTGERRVLVGFIVRETELNELAKGIVYEKLVGLSDDQRREKILKAIN